MADLSRALELLANPELEPGVLQRIAELHPELHIQVARHPRAWPKLLEWLATSSDPAVQWAVSERLRAIAQPQPAKPSVPAQDLTVAPPAFEARQPAQQVPTSDLTVAPPPFEARQPAQQAPTSDLTVAPPPFEARQAAGQVPNADMTQLGVPHRTTQPAAPAEPAAKKGRGPLIALIGGIVVALLAAAGAVWAIWLRPNTPPSDPKTPGATASVGDDTPAREGDFRNGAEKLWTVNASDLVSGGTAFKFGHDNGRTQLSHGPVAAGGSWLVKIRKDGAGDVEELVAIDAETGKARWTKQWAFESDCVAVPGKAQFLCVYPQVDANPGKALLVNAADGSERVLTDISARGSYAIAASGGLMVFEDNEKETRVHGFGLDGAARFDKVLASPSWLLDVGRPVSVVGDQVLLEYSENTAVLNLATGDELLRFGGFVQPTGYGHYVEQQDAKVSSDAKLKPVPARDGASPAVVSAGGQTVLLYADSVGLTLCDAKQPDNCQPVKGIEGAWSVPKRYELRIVSGTPYLILWDMQKGLSGVVDVTDAQYLGAHSESLGWLPAKGSPAVAVSVDSVTMDWMDSAGRMIIRHPITGAILGSVQLKEPARGIYPKLGYLAVGSKIDPMGMPAQLSAYGAAAKPTALEGPEGPETISVPATIPECPEGTARLAWAEITNGWVIVCGHSASEPTLIRYDIDGTKHESDTVTYDGAGIYRGGLAQGVSVRLAHSPAVVGIEDPNGRIMQQSQVIAVWFVALGAGHPATGPFGVAPPNHTAEDQVRYLNELIEKSGVARKSLASSVQTLATCTKGQSGDYSSEIAAIDEVTLNREEMLRALASAPVDLVPDGSGLLDELTVSIRHSYDADVAFASWGRTIQREGCHKKGSSDGEMASKLATRAKTVFAEHWNQVIAGPFSVRKLTEGDL